jgi:tetratricopeptide (TPR) repeat protein
VLRDSLAGEIDAHTNVEASLRLSYDMLNPTEQLALCQLSVFPASFDLEAAEGVLRIEADVEATLDTLHCHSLVEWNASSSRYETHDLVRVFALQQLGAAGSAVELRHAWHYARVAQRLQQQFRAQPGEANQALASFDRERVQIDRGWQWAVAQPESPEIQQLIVAYAIATVEIGALRYHPKDERIPQYERLLAIAQQTQQPAHERIALDCLASAHQLVSDLPRAREFYQRLLDLSRRDQDRPSEVSTLSGLGTVAYQQGQPGTAVSYYEQALQLSRAIDDPAAEAKALLALGFTHYGLGDVREEFVGDYRSAIRCYRAAQELAHRIGDQRIEAEAFGRLGAIAAKEGRLRQATSFHERALQLARSIGDRRAEATILKYLGDVAYDQNDSERATEYIQRALAIVRELEDRLEEAYLLGNLGWVYIQAGRPEQASLHLHECRQLFAELQLPIHPWFRWGERLLQVPKLLRGPYIATLRHTRRLTRRLGLQPYADQLLRSVIGWRREHDSRRQR